MSITRRLPVAARGCLAVIATVLLAACSTPAQLVQDRPNGGVVTYTITDDNDILSSRGRTDAMRLITEKCPGGHTVTRQGATSRIRPDIDRVWRPPAGSERTWGIDFVCKGGGESGIATEGTVPKP